MDEAQGSPLYGRWITGTRPRTNSRWVSIEGGGVQDGPPLGTREESLGATLCLIGRCQANSDRLVREIQVLTTRTAKHHATIPSTFWSLILLGEMEIISIQLHLPLRVVKTCSRLININLPTLAILLYLRPLCRGSIIDRRRCMHLLPRAPSFWI